VVGIFKRMLKFSLILGVQKSLRKPMVGSRDPGSPGDSGDPSR